MISFTSIPTEELKNKIAQFNLYCIDNDPVTLEPISRPCKFILEDEQGNQTTGVQFYNIDTLKKLRAAAQGRNVLCPVTRKKVIDKIDDLDGAKLLTDIYSTLVAAVNSKNIAQITAWLDAGGNPNQNIFFGKNGAIVQLFLIACDVQANDIVKLLIEKGANINQLQEEGTCKGISALFLAVAKKKTATVELLIEQGADLHQLQDEGLHKGKSALFMSTSNQDTNTIKLLIRNGAKVNQLQGQGPNQGVSALFLAAAKKDMATVELLIKEGADVNQRQGKGPYKGLSPLFIAANNGHTTTVELLIKKGAHVNQLQGEGSSKGLSALCAAVYNGFSAVASLLIEEGADIFHPLLDRMIKTSKNEAALKILNTARQKANATIEHIAKTILAKKLGTVTPSEAIKLSSADLPNKLRKHWSSIIKINKNCKDIGSKIAETDLSEEATNAAIKELSLPAVAVPELNGNSMQNGAPILPLASRKRSAARHPGEAAEPSIESEVPLMKRRRK